MPLYYVVPDTGHWGEEWATFCNAERPDKACAYALQQQDDTANDPQFVSAPRATTVGAETWAVYEISAIPKGALKNLCAIPWIDIPRTDWKLQ